MVRAGEGSTPLSVHQRRCLRTAASASCALRQCCMPRTRDSEQAGCPLVATGAGRREVFVRSNRPARRGVLEVVLPSSFRRHLHLFVQTPRHQTLVPAACPKCLRLLRPRQTSTILRHSSGERPASSASALSAATANGLHWSQASQLHGEHSQKASPCGIPLLHTLQVPTVPPLPSGAGLRAMPLLSTEIYSS